MKLAKLRDQNKSTKLNQSVLSLINMKFPVMNRKSSERSLEEGRSCHRGAANFPECISGLHLLQRDDDGDMVVEEEEVLLPNSSHFSLQQLHNQLHEYHDKIHEKGSIKSSDHSLHVVLAVLLLLCVSWLKENHLLPSVMTLLGNWLSAVGNFLLSFILLLSGNRKEVSSETIDAEGNLRVGNLSITTEKLGHG